jgi:PAS domain S-box-containing protein
LKNIFRINYLRNFFIISVIIAVTLPATVILYIFPLFSAYIQKNNQDEAVRVAKHLMLMIVPDLNGLNKNYLPAESQKKLQKTTEEFNLIKLKIFSKPGRVLYSTTSNDIGVLNKNRYFQDIVARGRVYTKVVEKGEKSLEHQIINADVVETYVPIMKRDKFVGAFEIYYNLTDNQKRLEKLLSNSSIILIFLTISLWGANFFVLIKAGHNIDQRERADNALRESEEKYRSITESMVNAMYICSPDFRVEFMNSAMIKKIGYDATGGRCFKTIYGLDEKCPWCIHEKVQKGEVVTTEIVNPKDGCTYNVSHSPIFHENGSISKMTIFRDITQSKLLEVEREKLIKELKDALDQVKQLSGLLPICASCKRIKDDKGDWHQIESYIRDHSEAEFTHGICQECVKKLYPGLDLTIYDD